MQAITPNRSPYHALASMRTATAGSRSENPAAERAAAAAGTQVSISAAGRAAASADPGLKLPDSVARWFAKDFSAEVLAEAKARLEAIRDQGELGAEGPANLPLLPESQALLDGFHAEMGALSAGGAANMSEEQSARFNLLMNLSLRVLAKGWQQPMTEADAQREFDIGNAMAKLANEDPSLRPPAPAGRAPEDIAADFQSGRPPAIWRERWDAAGLTMPPDATVAPGRSMWLSLAEAAGIGEDEFMSHVRDLSRTLRGHALTGAMESYISERHLALLAAQEAQAA